MREIVRLAFQLAGSVEVFVGHARDFYYKVALLSSVCPRCQGGLRMTRESHCRCERCGTAFDPTVAFQRCPDCDGRIRLRICRYHCVDCGADVRSRFVFDACVYDAEYFRERMAQSRQRKLEQDARPVVAVIEPRSAELEPVQAGLDQVPGLLEALNGLVLDPALAALVPLAARGFDLRRYEAHLQACFGDTETDFNDIPLLDDDRRLDRIWRFIAIIFMAHAGAIELRQEGAHIMVIRRADRKRSNVLDELEVPNGVA